MNRGQPNLFVASPPHPCSYLTGREATSLFVDPGLAIDPAVYDKLLLQGFRRSGDFVYRPMCHDCHACVPVRIPVDRFRPDRGQRRCWNANRDLRVTACPPEYRARHAALYGRYLSARHAGGGMDDKPAGEYLSFLDSAWLHPVLYEFTLDGWPLAVAAVDQPGSGLSAVYTFFDPDQTRRSLGTYAALWLIAEARRLGLPWLYLGYWIRDCRKMAYKQNFRPLQALVARRWIEIGRGDEMP